MPVYSCASCSRLISVSIIPGGNPAVASDPDRWARSWRFCAHCPALICERCAPPDCPGCPRCSEALREPTPGLLSELYFGKRASDA